jgi:hypothetical protein
LCHQWKLSEPIESTKSEVSCKTFMLYLISVLVLVSLSWWDKCERRMANDAKLTKEVATLVLCS